MIKLTMTAPRLRILLVICVFAAVALGVALFIFAYQTLGTVADDVAKVSAESTASQTRLQSLQRVQKQLDDQKDVVQRAKDIVAEAKSYQYQDQIISDLNAYASRAGVSITGYSFDSASTTGAAPTQAPAAAGTPATAAAPAPTGVKATTVAVTLKEPVAYANFLQFLHFIEQNLTKMQVSTITLTKGENADTITTGSLTIQVYTR